MVIIITFFGGNYQCSHGSIFMKYTRKSLENQTYQDFLTVVVYEPESEQIINNILKEYSNLPKNIIFTKNSSIPINDYIKDGDEVLVVRFRDWRRVGGRKERNVKRLRRPGAWSLPIF